MKDKELWTLSLASFFNDLGSDMIYPIWPLFVTSFLGANMLILGIIDGTGEAVVSISKGISGYLSDRMRKRKVFIWTGYSMAFLSRIGYALSTMWWHLVPFKILDRAGKIRGAPRDAIVADISKERGRNFGILRTMDNLGAVCGVLATLAFIAWLKLSLKTIFIIAAVPSLISAAIIIMFIKEGERGEVKKFSIKGINSKYKLFLASSVFLSLATFSYSFLLIFVKDAGYPDSALPLFYLLFTVIAALASYPAGKLSDRIGRRTMIFLSLSVYIIMLAGFIFGKGTLIFIALFVIYGLFKGIIDTVQTAYAADLAPKDLKATAIGGFQLVTGLAALPASTLAGLLWLKFGDDFPFALAIVFVVISFGILMMVRESSATV